MQTQSDIGHHNMYLHTRQFVENDKRLHKKAKKMDHRAAYQQNGSAIKLKQDYIARVIQDNPAFVNDDGTPMFPDGEPQDPRRLQRALSIVNSEEDGSQPTLAEAVLPWKRPEDEEVCQMPVKQNEFPAWASNKEYVNYYSPSNTFLGELLCVLQCLCGVKRMVLIFLLICTHTTSFFKVLLISLQYIPG
ncbi:hypothetical protein E2C01_035140 [Portunus trituberculatus]|uniref:Uncharacterized protein n=1 Tax=Portunus trituberculatus TaxID=210409 RepID=A0A5B7F3E4_PORTR|nr:hypothetical protein [Portunus trituberculatus]